MKLATRLLSLVVVSMSLASIATAALKEEHVSGGVLDLAWTNGGGVSNNMQPLTLDPSHPAYANPSGDHTPQSRITKSEPSVCAIWISTVPAGTTNGTST